VARILVVEDDEQYRRLLERTLAHAGHTVSGFADGREALRAFQEGAFDLLLTDLIMPEKDGLELIIECHRIDPALRILAISGGGRGGPGDYLRAARVLGATEVLQKPFGNQALLDAVGAALAAPPADKGI
jgi:DNA-binding NtrC family response regulator